MLFSIAGCFRPKPNSRRIGTFTQRCRRITWSSTDSEIRVRTATRAVVLSHRKHNASDYSRRLQESPTTETFPVTAKLELEVTIFNAIDSCVSCVNFASVYLKQMLPSSILVHYIEIIKHFCDFLTPLVA